MANHRSYASPLSLSSLTIVDERSTPAKQMTVATRNYNTNRLSQLLTRHYLAMNYNNLFNDDDDNDDDDKEETKDKPLPFQNFNPLNYKASKSTSAYSYSGTQISLRKTRMQELTNELLNVGTKDTTQTESVLEEYRDFLLEPLEELDAALDPDSIYSPQMTRAERYQAYRASMDERIETARNVQVKSVLTAMRDFVLSNE